MEKAMKCFEQGKSLDDFEWFTDKKMVSFYEPFTFKALKPLYEMITKNNRYTSLDFEAPLGFFLNLKRFARKALKNKDLNKFKAFITRFEIYFAKKEITSNLNFEPIIDKNMEHPGIRIEGFSIYDNLSYENTKIFAGVFAILGMKIIDFIYSKEDSYFRIDAIPTKLFFNDKFMKRRAIKLFDYNMSYITNYYKVVNDKDYYLWMKMAKDKGLILNFHNENAKKKWLNLIESDIKKFSQRDEFLINILNFFERLHWINIISKKDLIFEFNLSSPIYNKKKKFLLNYLSSYSKIKKMDDKYLLN
jgi:hypothetical protein